MLVIVCSMQDCRTAVKITGEFEEMDSLFGEKSMWYPDNYPCPRCRQPSSIIGSVSPAAMQQLDVTNVTAQEAFAAFNGLGLPEEQDCGPTAVAKLLLERKPVKLDVKLIKGTNRSVLKSIEFDDGTTMFLGASPWGSTVYRIASKRSFTDEVLGEQD